MDSNLYGTTKKKVERILEIREHTRDSDLRLMIEIWKEFYGDYISHIDGILYVKLPDLSFLPRESTVKRIRAKIQNEEGRFLPTSWEVAKLRGIEEIKWRKALGYYIEDAGQESFL